MTGYRSKALCENHVGPALKTASSSKPRKATALAGFCFFAQLFIFWGSLFLEADYGANIIQCKTYLCQEKIFSLTLKRIKLQPTKKPHTTFVIWGDLGSD
jgi:hypothetical protein